jgi:hypothetical protein
MRLGPRWLHGPRSRTRSSSARPAPTRLLPCGPPRRRAPSPWLGFANCYTRSPDFAWPRPGVQRCARRRWQNSSVRGHFGRCSRSSAGALTIRSEPPWATGFAGSATRTTVGDESCAACRAAAYAGPRCALRRRFVCGCGACAAAGLGLQGLFSGIGFGGPACAGEPPGCLRQPPTRPARQGQILAGLGLAQPPAVADVALLQMPLILTPTLMESLLVCIPVLALTPLLWTRAQLYPDPR